MERNTQPGRMEAQSRLVRLCPAMKCGWLKANLRFAEGCREHPGTVSMAVLGDRPDAVPLHGKSHRRELPTCDNGTPEQGYIKEKSQRYYNREEGLINRQSPPICLVN